MTPDIVAVLVVPAEGDPGGLVAPGPAPSLAHVSPIEEEPGGYYVDDAGTIGVANIWRAEPPVANVRDGKALILWWDGALVPEGWDRARRVAGLNLTPAPLVDAAVAWLAEHLVRSGLASRVVRLIRVEGRLVEVDP